MKSELIRAEHLRRKAIIYIRQSTPNQVLTHQESLKLQYALKERASELGWLGEDIEVIDMDLGISGKASSNREGFKEMLTKVTLGEVGIIISYEVTRLCRNCTDWYPLLDICGFKGCLIADSDGVYDPATPNGRLILGLKGQLSEVELHTIKTRLTAGLLNKARRGELALRLPAGLIRDERGQVHKSPDLQVQHSIELVFKTFFELGSGSKVLHFFREHHLQVPRYNYDKEIVWKKASYAAILEILNNPAYAGAFTYGRRKVIYQSNGRPGTQKRLPIPEWQVLIKDKYPAYISWESFEKIQAKLADNYAEYDMNKSRGIPREGAAMLHGIVYCGKCGHKMVVQYKDRPHYICNRIRRTHGGSVCQYISSLAVDEVVIGSFFKAISSVELNAYEKAMEKHNQMEQQIEKAHVQEIERLKYQADLARRQYDKADPENRLVTAELENRWEKALRELKIAQESYAQYQEEKKQNWSIPADLKEIFISIGKHLPDIWDREDILPSPKKKALLRSLIDKVVIWRNPPDQINIRIVWKGGETTTLEIAVNVGSFERLSSSQDMENEIIELSKENKSSQEIADILTKRGYRSPMKDYVLVSTVAEIRKKHGLLRKRPYLHYVEGYLTLTQVANILQVPKHWFYDRLRKGKIKSMRSHKKNLHVFPDTPETLEKFRKLVKREIEEVDFS